VTRLPALLREVRACTQCIAHLPHGVRPVLQVHEQARVLIAGQAPGRKVHETGIPFDDASGERLRSWMGVTREVFYDPKQVAILPMGFCFPGTGKAGDLPPRLECAARWRSPLLQHLNNIQVTLVLGQYAQRYHLAKTYKNLTETVKNWRTFAPRDFPLPHPSPRNNIWIRRNVWFESEVLPALQLAVANALASPE
jgi:uracil-DNA glycosylase